MPPSPKPCASCGRRITWRKKWEKNWDDVRYCSSACRRRGLTTTDRALEDRMRQLLGPGTAATVDVAEVARAFAASRPDQDRPDEDQGRIDKDAHDLLEAARRAARRLVASGEVVILQGGTVVDPSTAKGPIAIRRVRP